MICEYTFLTFDARWIGSTSEVTLRTSRAIKHPEPVLKLDAPWDTDLTEQLNYINVIFDPTDQLFKMWYVVTRRSQTEYCEGGRKTAYAASVDGIHWEKPIMDRVNVRGSTQNNYIIPEMCSLNYNILQDWSDVPERRFKITFTIESEETRWAKFHSPLGIAYSEDGLHWDIPAHVNPVLRGISDDLWGFAYDADRRKYLLFTRRAPNLPRDVSLYESHDLVNWEAHGVVLAAGDPLDPPEMFNLHGMAPLQYKGHWLGMLGTMYFLPGAESYTVFNAPPAHFPQKHLGVLDVQLAFSHDARHWRRSYDRGPLISVGEPGAPDSGIVIPARNGPFVINGETWIYYLAMTHRHTAWWQKESHGDADMRKTACCMLARVPEDRWTSFDAGAEGGWIITKPWGPPLGIYINADVEQGGSIECELLTPYGEPVNGFSRGENVPITDCGPRIEVKWRGGRSPHESSRDHIGGVCIKVHLKHAKLYALTLSLPDANGQLRRAQASAGWCAAATHGAGN